MAGRLEPMLFAWLGYFRTDETAVPQEVQLQQTDFLQQPYITIRSAGPLLDEQGRRAGMMMVFEVEDRAAAESYVAGSPFLDAGLYESHHLFEYGDEIG
jgi:hypothetical protein